MCEDIKPCPFCGCFSYEYTHKHGVFCGMTFENYTNTDGHQIRCEKCGAQTTWWHTKSEAVFAWNNRTESEIEALRAERDAAIKERDDARAAAREARRNALEEAVMITDELPNGPRGGYAGLMRIAELSTAKEIAYAIHALAEKDKP